MIDSNPIAKIYLANSVIGYVPGQINTAAVNMLMQNTKNLKEMHMTIYFSNFCKAISENDKAGSQQKIHYISSLH